MPVWPPLPSSSRVRLLLWVFVGVACSPRDLTAALPPPPPLPPPVAVPLSPYGFWGLNGFVDPSGLLLLRETLGLTLFHTATVNAPWAVQSLLPMVRDAGLRVTLRMTGDHPRYTTRTGDFDLDAWKAMLAPWGQVDIQPFIEDGTLAGHMLLDDIYNFAGRDPSAADLEEMARYSKSLLPGLMTFVREQASDMPLPTTTPARYHQVDAVVNQYKAAEGDVQQYARLQAEQAQALNLGVINGLNIANGGNGASHQPGWGTDRFAMSAEEIRSYGAVLAAVPACGMFLNWEYDGQERWSDGTLGSDYFDQPPLRQALRELGVRVAAHPPVPLLRASPPPPELP